MCREFTPKLVDFCKGLKEKENFEVVMLCLDNCLGWLCPFKSSSEVLTEARQLLVENYFQTPSLAWVLPRPLRISGRAPLGTSSPSSFRDLFTSSMDWQGQKLVELWMQVMLLVFAVVAFVTGYITASFRTMMLIYAGGVVFTSLVTVPNWPFFNRHPLKWLDPSEAEKHPKPQQQAVASKDKKKSSKK
ncbi:signal peptidase complex [Salix suchowensis]|nr:signal peptidase complex [Salix suchowensis]